MSISFSSSGLLRTSKALWAWINDFRSIFWFLVKLRAMGFNVGGKIGIARYRENLCVAIYMGIGVLNLNELSVGLAHRVVREP